MSSFLSKSEINQQAATLLKNNYMHCSSIHCSYYRCIQLMLHIANNIFNTEKGYFDEMTKKDQSSTHAFLIKMFQKNLSEKKKNLQRIESLEFQKHIRSFNAITDLKKLRTDSDYSDLVIMKEHSEKGINIAESVTTALQKIYLQ